MDHFQIGLKQKRYKNYLSHHVWYGSKFLRNWNMKCLPALWLIIWLSLTLYNVPNCLSCRGHNSVIDCWQPRLSSSCPSDHQESITSKNSLFRAFRAPRLTCLYLIASLKKIVCNQAKLIKELFLNAHYSCHCQWCYRSRKQSTISRVHLGCIASALSLNQDSTDTKKYSCLYKYTWCC